MANKAAWGESMALSPYSLGEYDPQALANTLKAWAEQNSGSHHVSGLRAMGKIFAQAFETLGALVEEIPLPPRLEIDIHGHENLVQPPPILSISKRTDSPLTFLLVGHCDTVYGEGHPFQRVTFSEDKMIGPGVADMKGGILILLEALKIVEKNPLSSTLGWQVLLTPDEEVGSPSSSSLLHTAAQRHHIGLIFEPSFPDGTLVSERPGSANFTVIAHGRAAHVGRERNIGRNALKALARLILDIDALSSSSASFNIGCMHGGRAVNIVPDLAICHLNMRANTLTDFEKAKQDLASCIHRAKEKDEGITIALYQLSERPPKVLDPDTQQLFEFLKECASKEGEKISWRSSGGVCDGNILAAAGLPTIDTLGVIGGELHTENEYALLSSIYPRAQLTARLMLDLASHGTSIGKLVGGAK